MIPSNIIIPKWILIVSGIFALMEIAVSMQLWFTPESVMEEVNMQAQGVDILMQMWATRQFALGFIFAFATLKRSIPMLTIAYLFLIVMFAGDLLIGIAKGDIALISGAIVMMAVGAILLFFLNRKRNS